MTTHTGAMGSTATAPSVYAGTFRKKKGSAQRGQVFAEPQGLHPDLFRIWEVAHPACSLLVG
jgi:hypothetical protein